MQGHKRQQRNTLHDETMSSDVTTASLQTLGMRIRQSISNGYKLPESNPQQPMNAFQRIPLPAHLQTDGPPALDYNGSTASSLSCWEEEINNRHAVNGNNFTNLNDFYKTQTVGFGTKRGIDEVESKDMQVNDYVARYGPLSFNEEF